MAAAVADEGVAARQVLGAQQVQHAAGRKGKTVRPDGLKVPADAGGEGKAQGFAGDVALAGPELVHPGQVSQVLFAVQDGFPQDDAARPGQVADEFGRLQGQGGAQAQSHPDGGLAAAELAQVDIGQQDVLPPAGEMAAAVLAGGVSGTEVVEAQRGHTLPGQPFGHHAQRALGADGFLAEGVADEHGGLGPGLGNGLVDAGQRAGVTSDAHRPDEGRALSSGRTCARTGWGGRGGRGGQAVRRGHLIGQTGESRRSHRGCVRQRVRPTAADACPRLAAKGQHEPLPGCGRGWFRPEHWFRR